MANQSIADRLKRLERGGCPVHGLAMGQVGKRETQDKGFLFLVQCPRRSCGIQATAAKMGGALTLTEEHQHLVQ